jgi:hypothetical protein
VNVGHLHLTKETGAKRSIAMLATITCLGVLGLFMYHIFSTAPNTGFVLLIFIAAAFTGEFLLQKFRKRKIQSRI